MSDYVGLLRARNFRLWFVAAFGSSLGDWIGLFALQVLVASLTTPGSRLALFALGGIMMARLLPSVLVGPVAGVLADRYDRKRLMVTTNLLRGILFVGIAFSQNLVTLFTLTFVVECLSLLFLSARDASLPRIVRRDQFTHANQLNLLVTYGTLPLGAAAASLLLGLTALFRTFGLPDIPGEVLALLFNAGTFLVSAIIYSRVDFPRAEADEPVDGEERPGFLEELREGLVFIKELPLIRSLILGVTGVFFGAGVVITLGPEFVRASLGGASTDWFVLVTAVGAGLVTGIVTVPLATAKFRHEKIFPVSLAATGALAALIALLPNLASTLVAGFLLGAAVGMSFVIGYTLLHAYTSDAVRGKTFASFYVATRVSMFAALAIAPFLAGAVGTITIIIDADLVNRIPGIRLTIFAGGVVALTSAIVAGRGMYRALAEEPSRAVRLPGHGQDHPGAGLFIAFEGVEGSGKSTQVQALCEALSAEGFDVIRTREPGGTPVAEQIRNVVLDPAGLGMHPRTEALLYAAARTEHVQQVILPALAEGKVVVCDRFLDSSLAYQGHGRGLGADAVFEINRWAIAGVLPDVVVLLDMDPEQGLERVAERARRLEDERARRTGNVARLEGSGLDRLEREDLDFHRRVAKGFLSLARSNRSRFLVVGAADDPVVVARQVRSGLQPWLPLSEAGRPSGPKATGEPKEPTRPEAAG